MEEDNDYIPYVPLKYRKPKSVTLVSLNTVNTNTVNTNTNTSTSTNIGPSMNTNIGPSINTNTDLSHNLSHNTVSHHNSVNSQPIKTTHQKARITQSQNGWTVPSHLKHLNAETIRSKLHLKVQGEEIPCPIETYTGNLMVGLLK